MQFALSFEFIYRYWNEVHTKHGSLFSIHGNLVGISLESEQKQGRE